MKAKNNSKNKKSENGLHKLVVYYQTLFDKDGNIHYYNYKDYQEAKRKFVQYSLKNREM